MGEEKPDEALWGIKSSPRLSTALSRRWYKDDLQAGEIYMGWKFFLTFLHLVIR